MSTKVKTNAIQMTARVAALLTLLIVGLAPFSMVYLPATLIVPGEAATTANHLLAAEGLFRAGMVSDALVFLIEIVLTTLLYRLIKPVNPTLALAATFARFAMTVVQGVNLLCHLVVLLLLSGASYLTVFAPGQLQAGALLLLNAHEAGVLVWGLFFGLHLLIFGYLVYQSGYLPKWLGLVLLVVALCYFVQSFGNLLFPENKALLTTLGSLAFLEIAFPLWLLLKGVNGAQWEKRVAEAA